MRNKIFFLLFCLSFAIRAQVIDKTVAAVGKQVILQSDIEVQALQMKADGQDPGPNYACTILEELLYQKLLVAQADKDSIQVKDEQVDSELDRRMNVFIAQFGGDESKLEAFYGKKINTIKDEFREDIRNQLLAQQMQGKIVGGLTISPSEVRAYYNAIPVDSLPIVNAEVEIGQLVIKAPISDEAKREARERIEGYRNRVVKGESMSALATLYTEDPGSVKTGGRYDNITRGVFVPEFEAVAFRLKQGEVSEVFETPFGYHFIELIARKGELVDIRHLLIAPKISNMDLYAAKAKLDSISDKINNKELNFCDATAKYSDEKETKHNCGLMMNMQQASYRFEMDELAQIEQNLVFMLDKMQVGEITKPMLHQTADAKQAYRIVYLKMRSDPHKANLKDDYQRLQNMALLEKQRKTIRDWVNKKIKSMYFKIDPEYQNCNFQNEWLNKYKEPQK